MRNRILTILALALLVLLAVPSTAGARMPTDSPWVRSVPARTSTPTGTFTNHAGRLLVFWVHAEGEWSIDCDYRDTPEDCSWTGPEGDVEKRDKDPVPGCPKHSLVGFRSRGDTICIGTGAEVELEAGESLSFLCNDYNPGDNYGSLDVTITVEYDPIAPPAPPRVIVDLEPVTPTGEGPGGGGDATLPQPSPPVPEDDPNQGADFSGGTPPALPDPPLDGGTEPGARKRGSDVWNAFPSEIQPGTPEANPEDCSSDALEDDIRRLEEKLALPRGSLRQVLMPILQERDRESPECRTIKE